MTQPNHLAGPAMTPASRRILLVEDSRTQAEQMRELLAREDLEVEIAPSGEAALESLNHRMPDAIVLDQHLPGIKGDDVCRRVRMNVNTRGIPILMLTSDESDTAQLRALDSGADDYVPKSADRDMIALRVRSLLRKSALNLSIMTSVDEYFKKSHVLAIDDSRTYLEFLRQELSEEGYSLKTASSGEEGIRMIQTEVFDCVLVDLMMPGVDGIGVCEEISNFRTRVDNPIVVLMLTAHESRDEMTRGLDAGADDFVGKSNDVAVLKGRIRALLRRKFFQEENSRIAEELKSKEIESVRARAESAAAEQRAAMADELRRSNEDLQQFAYIASHDLQEPLRMVSSYLQLITRRYKGKLDAEGDEFIGYAVDGAKRMQAMIRSLLDYSRIGFEALEMSDVPLRRALDTAVKNLEVAIAESGATVASDDLPTVQGDTALLTQLFQNLIANAVKFRAPGRPPVIRVHAAPPPAIDAPCDGRRTISVSDNGVGFSQDDAERIFRIFERLHGPAQFEGAGIGLAVCKKIIGRHGGRIWAESRADEGSTFHFTLECP